MMCTACYVKGYLLLKRIKCTLYGTLYQGQLAVYKLLTLNKPYANTRALLKCLPYKILYISRRMSKV